MPVTASLPSRHGCRGDSVLPDGQSANLIRVLPLSVVGHSLATLKPDERSLRLATPVERQPRPALWRFWSAGAFITFRPVVRTRMVTGGGARQPLARLGVNTAGSPAGGRSPMKQRKGRCAANPQCSSTNEQHCAPDVSVRTPLPPPIGIASPGVAQVAFMAASCHHRGWRRCSWDPRCPRPDCDGTGVRWRPMQELEDALPPAALDWLRTVDLGDKHAVLATILQCCARGRQERGQGMRSRDVGRRRARASLDPAACVSAGNARGAMGAR